LDDLDTFAFERAQARLLACHPFSFFLLMSYAGTAAVFVDELDACVGSLKPVSG
jgi:hypothetical protein